MLYVAKSSKREMGEIEINEVEFHGPVQIKTESLLL